MLVKYCKREHNIARGFRTIRLGTLRSYHDDDPNFLRADDHEGRYSVSKEHGVALRGREAAEFANVVGGNAEIAEGAKAVRHEHFPNCFIYCLSKAPPSLTLAHSLDPDYDDWFEIADEARFTSRLFRLFTEQVRSTDLELPSGISSFPDWKVLTIGDPVVYGERQEVLNSENFDEVMEPVRNSLKRIFLKPPTHQDIKEYRIAFVVTDSKRRVISVKAQPKDIQLLPSDPILSTVGIAA